jgi:hypothetical protein
VRRPEQPHIGALAWFNQWLKGQNTGGTRFGVPRAFS